MRVAYLTREPFNGSRYKYRQMFSRVHDIETLFEPTVKELAPFDALIVEGDRCRDYAKAIKAQKPYLLIQQDTWTIRAGTECGKEREMIENAAAILFTSDPHAEWMSHKYTMPPYRVVHLRPFLADIDFEPLPKKPGTVVYAGGITSDESKDGIYGYRSYHSIFRRIISAGYEMHVYPAWSGWRYVDEYVALGCITHEQVPERDLYRELSQYAVSLQGYAKHGTPGARAYIKGCRPNKLWLSLGAGIPTVGYNTGSGSKIYDGRWGLVAPSLAKLPATIKRASKLRIPDPLRRSEVMDADECVFRELLDITFAADPPPPRRDECRTMGERTPTGKEMVPMYTSTRRVERNGRLIAFKGEVMTEKEAKSRGLLTPKPEPAPVVPSMSMKRDELLALAAGLDIPEGATKAAILEALTG